MVAGFESIKQFGSTASAHPTIASSTGYVWNGIASVTASQNCEYTIIRREPSALTGVDAWITNLWQRSAKRFANRDINYLQGKMRLARGLMARKRELQMLALGDIVRHAR